MKFVKPVLFFTGMLAFGAVGFGWRDIQQGQIPNGRAAGKLFGVRESSNLAPEQVFRQSYNLIRSSYIKPVGPDDLKYSAMQGLMASMGDPHTMFMPPKIAQSFSEQTSANFYGVGAKLQPDPLGAKAVVVFEDGPAFKAGLRKNDLITAVNGAKVAGQQIEDIVAKVKGKEGTIVKITIVRPSVNKPLELPIRRARIITPTVETNYFDKDQVGYLSISQFSEPTAVQFDRGIESLEKHPMRGLVIDLRGNPGGLLESAQELLSRFVEDKVVVKMRGRNGQEEEVRTLAGQTHDFKYPIAVLIDEGSASAAEIFAGGLRDYGKATLMGTHSYGKASVQNVFPLIDHSSAKVTIAKYYLPSGQFIGRTVDEDGVYVEGGIKPSVEIPLDLSAEVEMGEPAKDNQLRRAIEVIKGSSANRTAMAGQPQAYRIQFAITV